MIILDISNTWKTIIMVVAMILVFYFFLIRPQNQQQKKEAAYRDSLKKGDKVMTTGGIHGVISSTDANNVNLEVANGCHIRVSKTAIIPIPVQKIK